MQQLVYFLQFSDERVSYHLFVDSLKPIELLIKQQRTEPTLSSRGQTFIIWIHIANLLNYFSGDTIQRPYTSLAALFPGLFPKAGDIRQGGLI